MSRRLLWASVATLGVLAITLLLLAFYTASPRESITSANFRHIKLGMSVAEVEHILGVSATEIGNRDSVWFWYNILGHRASQLGRNDDNVKVVRWTSWKTESTAIMVGLDGRGVVLVAHCVENPFAQKVPSVFDRFRDWLGW